MGDEPFTTRTVTVTTAISLLVLFVFVGIGNANFFGSWIIASTLNVVLCLAVGGTLQARDLISGRRSVDVA